jgi:hypothetical protein
MIIMAWIPGLALVSCLIISCEEKNPQVKLDQPKMYPLYEGSRHDAIRTGCYNGYLAACNCSAGTPRGVTCKADEDGCPTGLLNDVLAKQCQNDSYMWLFNTDDRATNMLALSIDSCERYLMTYHIVASGYSELRAKMAAMLFCEHRMPIWYKHKLPTPVEKRL